MYGRLLRGKCKLNDRLDSDYSVYKSKEMMEISREKVDTLYIQVTGS